MSKYLQIALVGTVQGVVPFNVTPVDKELPEDTVAPAQTVVALLDMGDKTPGDGQFEMDTDLKEKVRINLYITHLDTTVDLDLETIVRIVDKADPGTVIPTVVTATK